MIYHNSFDTECRSPFGAAPVSSQVNITVTADYACGAVLRLWTEEKGEELVEMHKASGDDFTASITMPDTGTLVWYYFIIYYPSGDTCLYGASEDGLGGIGREYQFDPHSYQITVYKEAKTPDWFKNSIMYQIFPDRFFRGSDFEERVKSSGKNIVSDWNETPSYLKNDAGDVIRWDFYGGTLKGVEEKLPYLKELGIGCIYLNPIFKAKSNHRYDTADYTKVDELLGDENAFTSLCNEARKLNIHIILDGVFSHTGSDSIYFKEGSKYRDWYQFNDDGTYKCWWGVKDLPEVNENNPSYIDYICGENGVIQKWIKLGADGFRLDVADELPDSFIKSVRSRLKKEKEDALLIGEVWEDASNKFSHGERRKYLMGEELDGVMNYPFRSILLDFALGKIDSFETLRRLMGLMEHYPRENRYCMMNILGTHDRERLLEVLDENTEKLSMLYKLLYCLPGVPCIYYGDEAGLTGSTDPENRAAYPWGKEEAELLSFFKELGKFYNEHSALKIGRFNPLYLNKDILSFTRENHEEKLIILTNRTNNTITINYYGEEYEIPANRTICKNI